MMRRTRGRGNNHGSSPNQGSAGNGGGGMPRRSGVPNRHQVFDSNGPDVRIRGNAWQVYDKYQSLARDAQSAGDRVKVENYLQHAEHYYRIILAVQEAMGEQMPLRRPGEGGELNEGEGQPQHAAEAEIVQPTIIRDPAQMPQPGSPEFDSAPQGEAVA